MELEINVFYVGILIIMGGFLFGLGMFLFNILEKKLRKKNYKEKRGG